VITESSEQRSIRVAIQQSFARFARPYALAAVPAYSAKHWGIND
jgi:hypothetical protein